MQILLTRIDLIVVGAPTASVRPLVDDFERRLGRQVTLNVRELKGVPHDRGAPEVLRREGERIIAAIDSCGADGSRARVVVCAIDGRSLSSQQVAERALGATRLIVVIGGALGLHDSVVSRADETWSFGRITLPHGMARAIAVEQLYRSFKIARGEPYHH